MVLCRVIVDPHYGAVYNRKQDMYAINLSLNLANGQSVYPEYLMVCRFKPYLFTDDPLSYPTMTTLHHKSEQLHS